MEKRTESFAKGDMEIVIATFAMHSDGKVPDVQVEKAEKWLRQRSKSDGRALRALPGRAARRTSTDMMRWGVQQPDVRAARSRSSAPEEESLWASAIRLRPGAGD